MIDIQKMSDAELLSLYHDNKELKRRALAELRKRGVPLSANRTVIKTVKQMIDFMRLCGFKYTGNLQSGLRYFYNDGLQVNTAWCAPFESPLETFNVNTAIDDRGVEYASFFEMIAKELRISFTKGLAKYSIPA